jgi:PAS domain S-box-containing protein
MGHSFTSVIRPGRALWNRLVEPPATVQEPENRRQSRILASLLITLIVIGLAAIALWIFGSHSLPFQPLNLLGLGMLVIAYTLNRSGRFMAAAVFAVVIVAIIPFALVIARPVDLLALDFLMIGVLLSSMFLSTRTTVVVALANLLAVCLLPLVVPQLVNQEALLNALTVNLITSLLIILAMYHRSSLEKDRQAVLERSERQLRYQGELLEQVSDAVISTDQDYHIRSWNKAAESIFGWKAEEVIGKPATQFIQTQYPGSRREDVLAQFHEQGYWRGEVIQPARDGRPINMLVSGTVLKDHAGNPIGSVSINRDITQRKKAETLLRESETRYRKISELTSDYAYAFRLEPGAEPVLEWVTEAFTRVTGYSLDEVRTLADWDRTIHPDDVQIVREERRKLFARQKPDESQFRIITRDGEVCWLSNHLVAEWDEGRIVRMYGAARDMTERKQMEDALRASEAKYRLLIEQAADGIFTTDQKGCFLDVNPTGCQMLGYNRVELLELNVTDTLLTDDLALAQQRMERLYAGETVLSEYRMRRKDGAILPVEASTRMLLDGSIQSIVRDISERKLADETVRENEERYRIISQMMGDYVYSVRVLPGEEYKTSVEWVAGAIEKITGHTAEEAIAGINWGGLIHPDDVPIVNARRHILLSGQKDISEFRMINKHGEMYWLRTYNQPIWDEVEGRVVRIYAAVQDITEHRLAEDALRASEKRFRALVENCTDEIVLTSPEGNILYAAPSSVKINGYSLDEYIGLNAAEILHPDDVQHTFQRYEAVLKNPGVPLLHQYRVRHKDGHWMWMEGTATNLLDDPAIGAVVVNQRDVTHRVDTEEALRRARDELELRVEERTAELSEANTLLTWEIAERKLVETKLAEERNLLRILLDNLPDFIYVKDTQGRFLLNNLSHLRFMGISNSDELIGKSDFDYFPEALAAKYHADEQLVMQSEQPLLEHEEMSRSWDGRTIWASTTKVPLRDPNGQIMGIVGITRDITERKHAEEKLAQERNLLRTIIDHLPHHIYVKDTESRFLLANPSVLQSLGAASSDDMIGKSDFDLFTEEAAREYFDEEQAVVRSGQPMLNKEYPVVWPEGGTRWLSTTKVPLRNADNIIIGLVGINEDITERKQNEAKLQYQAHLLDSVNDAVIASDEKFILKSWNPAAEKLYGWTAEEVLGKSWLEIVHSENIGKTRGEVIQTLVETGRVHTDLIVYRKDGRPLQVESDVIALKDDTDTISGYLSVNRDVTERKENEAKLQYQANLLAKVNDAVITSDEKFMLRSWNPAAEKMYGWKAEEVLGKSGQEVLRSEFIGVERAKAIAGLVETGQLHAELIQYDKDDQPIYVEGDVIALKDDAGNTTGYLSVNRDITERKRAENEIRKLNADLERRASELESANKELEAFSYSVSHDLRAPLRAMDGFSRILLTDYAPQLDEDAQRYLNLVRDNSQQMGDLITGLLNFSRLGRQALQKKTANPKDLIERVMQDLLSEVEDRQIELSLGDLPVCQADPILLKQVFANLLQNALKFTRQRAITQVEVGSQQVDGDRIYFVKDNGIGFDMRYAHKLFGVFQRMHRAEDFEGVGVGLATVQRIIHRHGGRIWAESEVGKGATFYFTLGGEDGSE